MTIEEKVEQLYAALGEMSIEGKLDTIKPVVKTGEGRFVSAAIDFTGGMSRASVANRASSLISSIACLKDHFKVWCKNNSKDFAGEELLNTERDVAIIHDLWNLDKHAELNRPSRSGFDPRLENAPTTALVVSSSTTSGPSSITFSFSPTGLVQTQGNVGLKIVGTVVDRDGNKIGDLDIIARRAVAAWISEFTKVGLVIER